MVGILLSSRLTSSPSPTTNTDLLLRGRPSTNTGENICRACWPPPIWQPVKTVLLGCILTVHGALLTLCAAVTHHFSYLEPRNILASTTAHIFHPCLTSTMCHVDWIVERHPPFLFPSFVSRVFPSPLLSTSYRLYPFFEPEARFLTKFHEW